MLPNPLITSSPERLGGTPVFAGTRVPVKELNEYLEAVHPLDHFLDEFPQSFAGTCGRLDRAGEACADLAGRVTLDAGLALQQSATSIRDAASRPPNAVHARVPMVGSPRWSVARCR